MTYIIYRLTAKVKKKFGADSCPEKCLHTELDGAEDGVDGQQHDALEAGELLSGKDWQAQEGHDKEHQRDIQDQGGVHSGNGAGLGDAEGGLQGENLRGFRRFAHRQRRIFVEFDR